MTTDEILFGLGLVLVLAVSSQLVARPLRVPAIVILLPAGFIAGAITDDVQPDKLLGSLYQPFVTIAVGIILFEAGLRLSFDEVVPAVRSAVVRLVAGGALITWLAVFGTVALLYDDMDRGVAALIGAILVVSGPTVVLPLLSFIRPQREVRSILKWEGTLIDPVGAVLGVLVFSAVRSGGGWQRGAMLVDLGVGALVAAVAAPTLWVLLRWLQRDAPRMVVPATTMVVVAAVVSADLIRDDAGLTAAVLLGAAMANQRGIDIGLSLFEFHETLVQLLVGTLFVLVAASVSPDEAKSVLPQALVLVIVMILVIRPLAVAVTMTGTSTAYRERAFLAWMAPRGIVAGATAAAFGPELAQQGVAGADKVLPIVFVAIFGTVAVYGLTAMPVSRILGVAGSRERMLLIVGGHEWARQLAVAARECGVAARIWTGPVAHQSAAHDVGLDADRGRLMMSAASREVELEQITDAFLLTANDDLNTLGAAELREELGHHHVFRIAPHPDDPDLVPPSREEGILGDRSLTFAELDRRVAVGARIAVKAADIALAEPAPDWVLLLVVSSTGQLRVAADGQIPAVGPGDRAIVLEAAGATVAEP